MSETNKTLAIQEIYRSDKLLLRITEEQEEREKRTEEILSKFRKGARESLERFGKSN